MPPSCSVLQASAKTWVSEEADDLLHGKRPGQFHHARQVQFRDLPPKALLQRAFANDAAAEVEAAIAQNGASSDEVIVALLFDQAAHAEDSARGARAIRSSAGFHEGLQIEPVVHALNALGRVGEARAQITRGVVAHGDHQAGVPGKHAAAGDALALLAEDVVGVGGEAVAEAVELPKPPAGPGADAGKVRVRMAHGRGEFAEAVPNPSGLIDAVLVRSLSPMTQGEHDALWEEIRVLPREHLLDEQILGRKEVDALRQVRRIVPHGLASRVVDGEDDRLHADALQLQDLPHAERLREGGKALEDVGEMGGCGHGNAETCKRISNTDNGS